LLACGAFAALCILVGCGQTPDTEPNARPDTEGSAKAIFVGTKAGEEWDGNGLKMKFCWCPAGKFRMGNPKDEENREDTEDQVSVTLSRGFWLGKYELTQGEWKGLMDSVPWSGDEFVKEGSDFPATHVGWKDAMNCCDEFTRQERAAGRLPADWQYTLPTEAQWEYACRAGKQNRFGFGDDEAQLREYAWFCENALSVNERYAHHVGKKRANAWGLHDMTGNVREWCRDWFWDLPGGTDPEVKSDEHGVKTDEDGQKVLQISAGRATRGACWWEKRQDCRAGTRGQEFPHKQLYYQGFRVALVQSAGASQ
jgi:formylglycine-generating enzyme required for sulfatase activity